MLKKRLITILSCCLTGIYAIGQIPGGHVNIIPEPVTVIRGEGYFKLPVSISIEAPALPALQPVIQFLKQRLSVPTGYNVTIAVQSANAHIRLILDKKADPVIGSEGYRLAVTPGMITIRANEPAGLFYGIQTLLQLLPNEIESEIAIGTGKWELPCVDITDYPRFGWRGLMFDVSRHFFTKKEVMDFIDQMARYKFNLFHWSLTNDEGWRIEIKTLPNLTKKGAWRTDKTGYFGTFSTPLPDEPLNYGGFYTQDDIKEVIQYAKDHFVNILPEVDVPGHSLAAIVSYPELSCTPGAEKYRVRSGEKIMEWHGDGRFTALVDNSLCPANEKVYAFLDKVFTEVAALFPFDYIHVGGDECAKNFWEKSDAIKSLMKKEGLKTMHEVQGYFEKRVGKIIASKGKKLIGWDEILEGGLAENAAVMSWRGEKGGIEAAKLKHDVVMSPSTYAYLDYMQGDVIIEPRVYSTLRLNKAYQFDPVPPGVDAKYIKGGQANIWTEQIPNTRHLQYMTWPRAFAIAECVWSPKEKKNWDSFVRKVEQQFKRYDIREIKYALSMYDPIFTAKTNNGQLLVELATETTGLDIYYSFDNSFPDRFYPKYTKAVTPPKDAVMLKVITYKGNQPVGRMIAMPLEEMNKRAGIKK
ncbi:MAG: family 20 glycosylhydrolase [Ferruginibacter sp.]|nr:family 20 glycosylhydrolase [Ferruginibacter sp.]